MQQIIHAMELATGTSSHQRETPAALNNGKYCRPGSHTRIADGTPARRHTCAQLRQNPRYRRQMSTSVPRPITEANGEGLEFAAPDSLCGESSSGSATPACADCIGPAGGVAPGALAR